MPKYLPGKGPWPHGCPTATCGSCHGSGMNKRKLELLESERRPVDDMVMAVKCGECGGRGRVITDDSSIRLCKHNTVAKDCTVCRRD